MEINENQWFFFSHVQTFRAIQEAFINSGLLGCQDLTSCEFKRTQRRRHRLRVMISLAWYRATEAPLRPYYVLVWWPPHILGVTRPLPISE